MLTWLSIIRSGGLFKPLETPAGHDWGDWVVDIRNGSQNFGGSHPLNEIGITDDIVNRCKDDPLVESFPILQRNPSITTEIALFDPGCPPPEASWLDYQSKCEIQSSGSQVTHRRYKPGGEITRTNDEEVDPTQTGTSVSQQYDTASEGQDYFIQDFGNDVHRACIRGYAIRIGGPTEPPRVMQIGGREVVLDNERSKISNIILSTNNQCSVNLTTWDLKYEILGYPTGTIEETESTGGPEEYQ